ncbi:unnamed protein product [Somion occarium]|uniref:DUF6533 domain-containing protein n=1 Tax=Somion occarium TaxID=3059160 RepID=A0ABP1DNL8_9APHY
MILTRVLRSWNQLASMSPGPPTAYLLPFTRILLYIQATFNFLSTHVVDVHIHYADMRESAEWVLSRTVVAALTFLFWDMLINLSDEIHYIWRARNTWVKWSYLYVRHFPIFGIGSTMVLNAGVSVAERFTPRQCIGWLVVQGYTLLSVVLLVDAILILRIYVLFARNRALLVTLLIAFAIETSSMIICAVLAIPKMVVASECLILKTPAVYAGSWLASMGMQTILFVLTCYRFYTSVDRRLGTRSILHVLIRDGMWAYALIFSFTLMNILLFRLNQSIISGICFAWAIVVFSFAGSHLQLNVLKELIHPSAPSNVLTSTEIDFGSTGNSHNGIMSTLPAFPVEDVCIELQDSVTRH